MSTVGSVAEFTARKIGQLLGDPSDSSAKARLARLRSGIGHYPGEQPALWGEFLLEMPQELLSSGNQPSRAEWAVYLALTAFALHQQGKSRQTEKMHREGISLGMAARQLIETEDDRERVARRFYPLATATDMEELSHHLRTFITLLRAKNIPLDYARLAGDLYQYQFTESADQVRLRWGEDFCRINVKDNTTQEENKTES